MRRNQGASAERSATGNRAIDVPSVGGGRGESNRSSRVRDHVRFAADVLNPPDSRDRFFRWCHCSSDTSSSGYRRPWSRRLRPHDIIDFHDMIYDIYDGACLQAPEVLSGARCGTARHDLVKWYTWAMPTTLRRTQITHVARVQRIIDAGRQWYPGASDAAILVNLAEERVNERSPAPAGGPRKRNGLTLRSGRGVLTTQMVLDVLNED